MSTLSPTELERVAGRLTAAGAGPAGPLTAELIAGGRSNLTFRIGDGNGAWVLRMPPRHGRTPSAHDVAREHEVTSALQGAGVPVACPVLLCEDESVLGAPFTVVEFVSGRTVRTAAHLDELDDRDIASTVRSLLEALVALHEVDHVAVGLERFGRATDYAARQLATWSRQWAFTGDPALADLEAVVRGRLEALVPEQRRAAVVHGDFRIDNTLLDQKTATRVLAVVDWELSTVGDPIADVATMAAYRHPAFDLIVGEPSAWASPRLPDAAGLAEGYAAAGGADLVDWGFHLALAHYKVAAIAAGIAHRHREGSGGGGGFETAGRAVQPYLEAAVDLSGAIR